jgi:indolepyruvate ferredoxin oxidoreductase beta subunit
MSGPVQKLDILLAGVGGQGTLVAGRVLGEVALALGMDVKVSEVHGMSQRGGSVVTYVRMGKCVHSPLIEPGEADFLLAFEQLEALRWAPYLAMHGTLVVNRLSIQPLTVSIGAATYPQGISETLSRVAGESARILSMDASGMAKTAGSAKSLNVAMLGAMAACSGIERKVFEDALDRVFAEKFRATNRLAFTAGFEAACT